MSCKIIIIIIIQIVTVKTFSQNKKDNQLAKDTLECFNLNQKIEHEDNHLVWINLNNDLKKIAANNLLTKRQVYKKTFLKYYSISLLNQGAFYHYTDRYQLAIEYYKKSFSVANDIKFYTQCASSLQNIGSAFDFLGKIDSSIVYFEKALIYAKKSNNKSNIAYVLTDLGFVNNNLGNNEIAINYNLKALKIFTKLEDNEGIERTNFAIGRIFDNLIEYEKSLEYYKSALLISIKINNKQRQCLILNSIANVYFIQKKYDQSEFELLKCLAICKRNNYVSIAAVSENLLGDISFRKNDFQKAKKYYLNTISIFKANENNVFYSKTLLNLAKIYSHERNIPEAEKYAIESYNLALKNNYPLEIKAVSEVLSQIYINQKKYYLALKFKNIISKINDSIFYDENKNIALKAEFKYNTSLKEAQIKSLSQQKKIANLESERQKTIALFLGIAIISLLITSYFLFNRYKIKKQNELLKLQLIQAEKTIEAEKKATESELKALKSQMNPHFIFNALSSIQDQFMYGDKVIANEQMGNFTYLTRQILNVSGKKQILLATEIDILSKYLELEKMRFTTDFEYEITTCQNIDVDYHEIPPMLIQPFVENSIKHGLLHKSGPKKLSIDFELDASEEYIICTIIDNGIGRQKSAEIKAKNQTNHQSFSTGSIENRLELWNVKTANSLVYQDIVDSSNNVIGTKVVMKVEIH